MKDLIGPHMYRMSGDHRPRIIRRVMEMTRSTKKKPARTKRVRDYKILVDVTRVKAQVPHVCGSRHCPWPSDLIPSGEEYAKVDYLELKKRIGKRLVPDPVDFHFGCVPDEVKPLVRFFKD